MVRHLEQLSLLTSKDAEVLSQRVLRKDQEIVAIKKESGGFRQGVAETSLHPDWSETNRRWNRSRTSATTEAGESGAVEAQG